MAETTTEFTGNASVEDVMATLARQSIFDLPSLVRQLVDTTREEGEKEDDPVVWDFFIHSTYVLQHVGSPHIVDEGGEVEPL